jgi:hypothetical protein
VYGWVIGLKNVFSLIRISPHISFHNSYFLLLLSFPVCSIKKACS